MARNPFGDYSTVDLSSIYQNLASNAAGGNGAITQPTTTPTGSVGGGGITGPQVTQGGSGPGIDPQGPGGSFAANSVQGQALAHPNDPYIGTSESGGIAYTPEQARAWWAAWFANPVNLLTVDPVLLPGSLVLSSDEIARAQALQRDGTLPPAPANYNPLGLQVNAGSNGLSSFGGYGSAEAALTSAHRFDRPGTEADTAYANTIAAIQQPAAAPAAAAPTVDYAALAATDRKYAANLAKSDPAKSQMYLQRAAEYEARAAAAQPAAPAASTASANVPAAAPQVAPSTGAASVPAASAAPQQRSVSPTTDQLSSPASQIGSHSPDTRISQPASSQNMVPVYINGVRTMVPE